MDRKESNMHQYIVQLFSQSMIKNGKNYLINIKSFLVNNMTVISLEYRDKINAINY